MAATYSYSTGDGVTTDLIQLNIGIPDANGGNVVVAGSVKPVGAALIAVSQTVALPAAPGSGSIFIVIECNRATGAITVLQSTSSFPALDANCDAIFQDILTASTTDPALDPNNQDL